MQKDKLFDLIKSLDKNEKGYVKRHLFNRGNSHSSYFIKLFEAIQKQSVYDEKALKDRIKDKHILRSFAVHKVNLYKAIMRFLINYQSESSIENQIKILIRTAEILRQKTLYKDANDTLLKALKLSTKNDFFLLTIEIRDLLYRYNLNSTDTFDEKWFNFIEINQEQINYTVKKYSNLLDYRSIYINYLKIITSNASDQIRKRELLIKLLDSTNLNSETNALSFAAKFSHNQCKGVIYLSDLYEPKTAVRFFQKAVSDYEKFNGTHSQDRLTSYFSALNNVIVSANMGKMERLYTSAFRKMNQLATKQHHHQLIISQYIICNRLLYLVIHSKLKEGLLYVSELEKELHITSSFFNYIKCWVFNLIAIIHFMNSDYHKSTYFLKKIVLDKNIKLIYPELNCFAFTLWLLSEYQLQDFDYIQYLLRSIEKKVGVLNCDKTMAIHCFQFIKSVNYQTDRTVIKNAYSQLSNVIKRDAHFSLFESNIYSLGNWAQKMSTQQ